MPMDAFRKKIDRATMFDVALEVTDIINSNQQFLTGLLKNQLAAGKDGNGDAVTIFGRDYYMPETLAQKARMSGLAGEIRWITNYMSGDFYRFLGVKASGSKFEFISDVEYYWEIINRSDSVIMELNQESLTILREQLIKPELERRFQLYINGV